MGKTGSRVIRGSTGRFLTLVLAPLVVVGVTAIVMLPRGGDDKVKVNADGPVVDITSPQTKSRFNRNTIQVVARVSDPDGLATAELRVQGKRVATISLSGASDQLASFNWEAERGRRLRGGGTGSRPERVVGRGRPDHDQHRT